ncbi:hypothetical protein F4604DRAFT_1770902 [Suillus subluteus]|nr:hypothetical protein F4604DRAFT_1770902 [Suillus subluteus]
MIFLFFVSLLPSGCEFCWRSDTYNTGRVLSFLLDTSDRISVKPGTSTVVYSLRVVLVWECTTQALANQNHS